MMLKNLIKHAREIFPMRDYLDPQAVLTLRRRYVKARLRLGNNWILARK